MNNDEWTAELQEIKAKLTAAKDEQLLVRVRLFNRLLASYLDKHGALPDHLRYLVDYP